MSTQADLADFHAFVSARLGAPNDPSLEELFQAWVDAREREQVLIAVRRGLADIDAGRDRPALEAIEGAWRQTEARTALARS